MDGVQENQMFAFAQNVIVPIGIGKNGSLGYKPRRGKYTNCLTCGKQIYLCPSHTKKYCSKECFYSARVIIKTERRCSKCKTLKPLKEFGKSGSRFDGHDHLCKSCNNMASREWRKDHPDKIQAWNRGWYKKNKKKSLKQSKKWRIENPGRAREISRLGWERWQELNPEKVKEARIKNSGTVKAKLCSRMSSSMRKSLKGGKQGRKWESLAGYTVKQLKKHLEKQFINGMSWENMGAWHIDHKTPKAVFNFEKPEDIDFKRCWALKNLQPLWVRENCVKNDKLDKPFQPSFLIG